MSEQDDDLELQALQRQLDDAFSTARPRQGFADDLWLRMQARRPFWERAGDVLSGLWTGIREVPAVPAAAVAVVLVIAIGAAVVTLNGRNGLQQTTSGQSASSFAGGAKADQAAHGPFGTLPRPMLQASGARLSLSPAAPPAASGSDFFGATPSNYYFGPAKLTWSGGLPKQTTGTVYRFTQPGSTEADAFAAGLGASPQRGQPSGGTLLGTYRGSGFTLTVNGITRSPAQEAFYFLTADPGTGPAGGDPGQLATVFLTGHSILPTWPYSVSIDSSGDNAKVRLLREFPNGGAPAAYLVDPVGDPYGLEVDVRGGQAASAAGPIPVNLDTAVYPIASPSASIQAAMAFSNPNAEAKVTLTRADFVYALAFNGVQGFYEPCYLFSGTFQLNGVTYLKRVLVPAVASS